MSKKLSLILSAVILGAAAGCQHTPEGKMRAGVPFVKDTIESRYQRTVPQIFQAARQVLELNGTLTGENTIANSLEAKVDNRTVIIKADEVEPGVSRVRVEARRRSGRADVDLAAEIDKQIALKLSTGAAR